MFRPYKIIVLFFALCCLHVSHFARADTLKDTSNTSTNAQDPDPSWFCDHWPSECLEVCESGMSPWGPYTTCSLRPPWDTTPDTTNPYSFIGETHNTALTKIGANGFPLRLDKRLATTHMIQKTAEYLCEVGIPDKKGNTTFTKTSKEECFYRNAGIATKVIDGLSKVIYADLKVKDMNTAYLRAFSAFGKVSEEQLSAIKDLYALFPNDENIEELPYIFERMDEYTKYIELQMPEEEAELVLLGASVMRASLAYWLNQADNPSDWFGTEGSDMEPQARRRGIFLKILKIVAADAGGCLGGAIILGVPGCVIGGIGASAGAGAAS